VLGSVFPGRPERRDALLRLAADVARLHEALVGKLEGYGLDVEIKLVEGPRGPTVFVKQARLLAAPSPAP